VAQYSIVHIITLHGRITAREYVDRLVNQVHPMIQTFPNNDALLQDDNAVRNLYESIPRKPEVVLKAMGGPTTYYLRNMHSICSVSIILSNACIYLSQLL
jgi:hypothetical protein